MVRFLKLIVKQFYHENHQFHKISVINCTNTFHI